jgi:hypothetical protein
MSYQINRYNGTQITVIADGTIDATLDLKLIGKNYAGYGTVQNENFVYLLENFANTNQPPKPISGQIWFDSGNSKLKFYDGNKFRTTGGAEVGAAQPTGLTVGDLWFDTVNKQLYTFNGNDYTLVGPQAAAGSQTTEMRSRRVRAQNGNSYPIVEAVVDGVTVFIVSKTANPVFRLDGSVNAIAGFTDIQKGVTLSGTTNASQEGQTQDETRFWGTATNADRLGGLTANQFVQAASGGFTDEVDFSDKGFYVGNPVKRLHVYNEGNLTPIISNAVNEYIKFRTTDSSSNATYNPLTLFKNDILPGTDAATNLGSSSQKFLTVFGSTFTGAAAKADSVLLGSSYVTASTASVASSIVARDSNQDINANFFRGTATAANYADLAEKYLADQEYAPGTVVKVGGDAEVTAAGYGDRPIGVISTNPAFMMNKDLVGGTYVALKGRVPTLVYGPVSKGDQLIASGAGYAKSAADYSQPGIFAVSLQDDNNDGVRLVECVIL